MENKSLAEQEEPVAHPRLQPRHPEHDAAVVHRHRPRPLARHLHPPLSQVGDAAAAVAAVVAEAQLQGAPGELVEVEGDVLAVGLAPAQEDLAVGAAEDGLETAHELLVSYLHQLLPAQFDLEVPGLGEVLAALAEELAVPRVRKVN